MKKTVLTVIISALVVAAAVSAGFFAHDYSTRREVKTAFKSELESLLEENKQLDKRRKELKNSVSQTEQSIEDKNEVSAEAEEYAARLEELQQELDEANRTLIDIDSSIQKKEEYIEQAGNIKSPSRGSSFSASDKTLDCPDDISAGRYTASGRGNLLIYNSSDKLRISENLSTIDTNSFTFNIAEGESVKVTESVTFTRLK